MAMQATTLPEVLPRSVEMEATMLKSSAEARLRLARCLIFACASYEILFFFYFVFCYYVSASCHYAVAYARSAPLMQRNVIRALAIISARLASDFLAA